MDKCCIFCVSTASILKNSAWIFAFCQASDQRCDDLAESCRRCYHILVSQKLHKHLLLSWSRTKIFKRMKESDSDNPNSSGSSCKRLRSTTEGMFNFREHCLFYGEKCQVIRPQKISNREREAYLCRTAEREGQISFKESVIRYAERRSDNWEMTSHSEHTLPSVTCMLLMLIITKFFFVIFPLHSLRLSVMEL